MIKFYQNNHSLLTISTFSYKKTLINYIFFINNNHNKNILEIYFYNTENRKIIKINNSSKILILH